MKVKLTRDAVVRFERNSVVDVSEAEASRLISLKNAVEVKEKKSEPKKKKTTKAKEK